MRCFLVPEGTKATMIQDGQEWYPENMVNVTLAKERMFFLEDMTIDPAGILSSANGPGNVTIGSAYAGAGYYGFRADHKAFGSVTLLVNSADVTVG